jgi:inorganic pyrophosphatase
MIEYDRTLQTAMDYPGNYGFIPDTMGGDDDPLDVILYNEYPIYPNTLIKIRIIGALEMMDEGKEDYKILAVPIQNKKINDINDIPESFLLITKHFFQNYKMNKLGEVETGDWVNKKSAIKVLKDGISLCKNI